MSCRRIQDLGYRLRSPLRSETTEGMGYRGKTSLGRAAKFLNYFCLAFAFRAQKPKEITAAKETMESEGEWICIYFSRAAESMIKWLPELSIMTSNVFAFKLRAEKFGEKLRNVQMNF